MTVRRRQRAGEIERYKDNNGRKWAAAVTKSRFANNKENMGLHTYIGRMKKTGKKKIEKIWIFTHRQERRERAEEGKCFSHPPADRK